MAAKLPTYIMFALMIIGVITFMMVFSDNYDSILYIVYAYFGIALIAAVGSSLYNVALNPKNLKGSLIGLGALVVVLGTSYVLASDVVLETYGEGVTPMVSKLSDAGLIAFYILFVVAIGSIVFSAVSRLVK